MTASYFTVLRREKSRCFCCGCVRPKVADVVDKVADEGRVGLYRCLDPSIFPIGRVFLTSVRRDPQRYQ